MLDSFFAALAVSLAISLVLTLIVEVGMAMIMEVWEPEDLRTVVKVNCITNPIVVSLTDISLELTKSTVVKNVVMAVLEIRVVWVEMLMYRRWLVHWKKNTIRLSLVLNASSFGLGVVFSILFF